MKALIPIATEFRQKPSRDDRKRRQGWKLTAQTCTGSFQLALQLAAQLAVKLAAPALRLQQGDPLLRAQKKKKKEHKHTPQKKPRLSAQLAGCTAGSTTRGAEDVNDTVKEAYTNCHFFSHGARRFLHPRAALLAQRKKRIFRGRRRRSSSLQKARKFKQRSAPLPSVRISVAAFSLVQEIRLQRSAEEDGTGPTKTKPQTQASTTKCAQQDRTKTRCRRILGPLSCNFSGSLCAAKCQSRKS